MPDWTIYACTQQLMNPTLTQPSQPSCLQGITFVNQYIIVGTLGQGAFGKVKLVLNSQDMNLYAVKLLSKGSLMRHQRMRPRTASDFQAEAQRRMNVISLLHHPNIICPFEVIGQCSHDLYCSSLKSLARVQTGSVGF